MSVRSSQTRRGFTLVELLVVIGIIALLISILLPSLNSARRAANATKCLANLRTIGQAFQMYAIDNKGAIVPTIAWNGGNDDAWPFVLVTGRYLPNPRIKASPSDNLAAPNTVLVCPTVRSEMSTNQVAGTSGATSDGFERRISKWMATSGEPTDNGASGRMILDFGYAVNGTTNAATSTNGYPSTGTKNLPMQGAQFGAPDPGRPMNPGRKFGQFRKSSQTVLVFDGSQWNVWNVGAGGNTHIWRITGARHGKWSQTLDSSGIARPQYTTGTTNVLFLDGHVQGVPRAELPYLNADCNKQILGTGSEMLNNTIIWNSAQ